MRKEYSDRWAAPLVNPPVTYGDWQAYIIRLQAHVLDWYARISGGKKRG